MLQKKTKKNLSLTQLSELDNRIAAKYEKHSSSSSGSSTNTETCSNPNKTHAIKLDALKHEIDKTMNEISTFKSSVLDFKQTESVTIETGVNTDISMSNAVFKIKYDDEEDDESKSTLTNSNSQKIQNFDSIKRDFLAEPLIESPSETQTSTVTPTNTNIPALTFVKKIKSSKTVEISTPSPKTSKRNHASNKMKFNFQHDYLRNCDSHEDADPNINDYEYLNDDTEDEDNNNIFKRIFTRSLSSRNVPSKKFEYAMNTKVYDSISSSGLSSSSSCDSFYYKDSKNFNNRRSTLLRKKIINTDSKRHSFKGLRNLSKLPVFDFGTVLNKNFETLETEPKNTKYQV